MARKPSITKELENLFKEAILSVLWTRSDIIDFLKNDCGLTDNDLKGVSMSMTRAQMVGTILANLKSRNKHRSFHDIYSQLAEWTVFDSYWFQIDTALDSKEAKKFIRRLKKKYGEKNPSLVTEKDSKRRSSLSKNSLSKKTKKKEGDRNSLRERLFNLENMEDAQQRGREFESFFQDLLKSEEILVSSGFQTGGEQIDCSFNLNGEDYIVELKWHKQKLGNKEPGAFIQKVRKKGMYPRGVFISYNGYSSDYIGNLGAEDKEVCLLLDGSHIFEVVEGRISFADLIRSALFLARTKGIIYPSMKQIYEEALSNP